MSTEENATSRWLEETHHHADGRRFASAVWSEEAKNFAFGDVEIQIVHSGERAKTFGKVFELDHMFPLVLIVQNLHLYLADHFQQRHVLFRSAFNKFDMG